MARVLGASAASALHVRVGVASQGTANSGAGGSAALGMNARTGVGDAPAVNLSFNPDGTADGGRVDYVGVHEFGHVLGFIHEQDLPANVEGPAHCDQTNGVDPAGKPLTRYDGNSIMNDCDADGNAQRMITDLDIDGVQSAYGARVRSIASVVQLHAGGEVWRYTRRACTEAACAGWALIDRNARAIAVVPFERIPAPSRLSSGSR